MNTPKDSTAERTPGSLHPACSTAPCILCKIIGHKWALKVEQDDKPSKGYTTIHRIEKKACVRCGTPNPNYGAQ